MAHLTTPTPLTETFRRTPPTHQLATGDTTTPVVYIRDWTDPPDHQFWLVVSDSDVHAAGQFLILHRHDPYLTAIDQAA